ncbi:MAG: hypothetical protein ACKPKM_09435 [Dolichospermum sp.]
MVTQKFPFKLLSSGWITELDLFRLWRDFIKLSVVRCPLLI